MNSRTFNMVALLAAMEPPRLALEMTDLGTIKEVYRPAPFTRWHSPSAPASALVAAAAKRRRSAQTHPGKRRRGGVL